MRASAPIALLLVATSAVSAGAVTPVASQAPNVDTTSASTTQIVGAAALERLPTASRDLHELLLLVPGTVSGAPVDQVQVALGGGSAAGARPTYLQPGWSYKASGSALTLSGPPVGTSGVRAAFALPNAGRKLAYVDLRYYQDGRLLLGERLPPRPLNPPVRLSDPGGAIRLPVRLSPGDRVFFRPLDPKFTPGGGDWKIGGWTPKWNGSYDRPLYQFDVPRDLRLSLPLKVSYVSPWQETLVDGVASDVRFAQAPRPPGDAPALTGCSPAALDAGPVCLCGNFPPDALAELRLNGKPVGDYLVSGTPSIAELMLPADFPAGAYAFDAGASSGFSISDGARGVLIRVGGEIDRNKLRRGESTPLKLWLDGTDRATDLRLWNSTPQIVSLAGGDDQVVTTSGGMPNQVSRTVNAVKVGDFALHYQLTVDSCPCAAQGEDLPPGGSEDGAADGRIEPPQLPAGPVFPAGGAAPAGVVLPAGERMAWESRFAGLRQRYEASNGECRDAATEALLDDSQRACDELEKYLDGLAPKMEQLALEVDVLPAGESAAQRAELESYRRLGGMLEGTRGWNFELELLPRCDPTAAGDAGGGRGADAAIAGARGGESRKGGECTLEREPRNEGKEIWYRCVKGASDSCAQSCQLWRAKKSDNSDPEKIGDPGEWKKAEARIYKYYCLCK